MYIAGIETSSECCKYTDLVGVEYLEGLGCPHLESEQLVVLLLASLTQLLVLNLELLEVHLVPYLPCIVFLHPPHTLSLSVQFI